jgi:hypothetical protein
MYCNSIRWKLYCIVVFEVYVSRKIRGLTVRPDLLLETEPVGVFDLVFATGPVPLGFGAEGKTKSATHVFQALVDLDPFPLFD